MSAKTVVSAALLWTALAAAAARAQYPPTSMSPLDTLPPGGAAPPPTQPAGAPAKLSSYITYDRPCACYGPVGGDGPVETEVFARTGPSFLLGGGTFYDTLQTGWAVEGGARLLLFDADLTRAWTVTFGVLHVYNHGKNPGLKVPFNTFVPGQPSDVDPNPAPALVRFGVDVPGVTIRSLNRTFVNLGFGREWYLLGSGDCDGPTWRVGFDAGGRYGMANLELHELRHRIDVIGGAWFALHGDVEIPWGCCTLYAGLRAEWNYTWSDVLQIQNNSDLQDLNLMLTFGVRF